MAMKYTGAGAYIHGVPARDLTDEEEARYGGTIKEQERLTGMELYRKVATPKPPITGKKDSASAQEEGK